MRRVKYHKYADEACDKADTEIERKYYNRNNETILLAQ